MINEKNPLTSFVEDSRRLWIRLGRLEKKAPRHSLPRTVRCLAVVVLLFAFVVPVAKAGKESGESAQAIQDPDRDGLESRLETELGTNPRSSDKDGESKRIDIAIEDKDLLVIKESEGLFRAVIGIYNKGSAPSPKFGVYFYAGDPDKGGRLLATHGSGPIMPGDIWREGTLLHRLKPDENTISVVVDPDNKIDESDETNNKASRVIPGRQREHKTESAKIDIAIGEENLTVTKVSDGSFKAVIAIWNKGSRPLPRFRVNFYAGDPDKGGRLLSPQAAGPIMPGDGWREYNPGLKLRPGEDVISVVVDPDNAVDESDETNNKASRVIPGRQTKHKTESVKVDIAIGDKDLIVTKLSDRLFEAMIPIHNKGSVPLPRFKVYFYAGDPDKGGRLLSTQNAGPIKPGGSWLEGTHPHRLKPGEDTFSVVLDPDNTVEESNETNNKSSQTLSKIVSESEEVVSVGVIRELDLSGDDILQVEAQASKDFNFPYYLFIPTGIDKHNPIYILVQPNNSGMVSDDPGVHQAKALTLVKKSHANKMARRLGVPLLVPTFPRPRPETHSWAYTHALDIDTLEIEEGKLKRVDLQLTAMIKYAQELLRTNGFKINYKVFMHGFSASAKFCNRYSYLHPEMVKAAAAGGVNGLPTLPVREWNGYELPFPIGIAGIEKLTGKPFDERAFRQVAHYIYMGSSDRNDTLFSREAWREEEADIIRKALAAEKMMPDRWEISRKIYLQQKLPAQLVTYNGVGHSIQSQMLDDVIDFFKANTGEKFVRIKPFEYPRRQSKTSGISVDLAVEDNDLSIEENPNGSFDTVILIHNRGSVPSPQFRVNFYAGDPDDGGRLLSEHGAGPIMPGDVWAEGHHGLMLKPGEDTITVVIDPYNKVEESNETNNKVSKVIPGKQ